MDSNNDRHHQSTDVLEANDIEIRGPLQQRTFFVVERFKHLLKRLASRFLNGELVVIGTVVEILQARLPIGSLREFRIALLAERRLSVGPLLSLALGLLIRITTVDLIKANAIDRYINMVGAVKPASPKPIEVDTRRVFHRAKKVRGRRPLEFPTSGVFAKGKVKQLTSEDGFAKNVQRRRRFGIGIGAKLEDFFAAGHDRALVVTPHVRHDLFRITPPRRILVFPLLLRQVLQERIDPLIHPGPLSLVAVYDHGEKVVANLVDDHRDQAVFRRLAVGTIRFRSWTVEADHRIFHPIHRTVDANGHRIGILERVAPVDLQGVGNGLGGILAPERFGFIGIVRHRHHGLVADLDSPGIPDELATGGESKIADILGLEHPCLCGRGCFFGRRLVLLRLLRGHDEHRSPGVPRLCQAVLPIRCQNLVLIGQLTSCSDDHVGRNGDANEIISQLQGELAASQKLFVLPACVIGVRNNTRKPLSDFVDVIAILLKELVTGASPQEARVDDIVRVVDRDHRRCTRRQRFVQVESHHRPDHRVADRLVLRIRYRVNLVAAIERHACQQGPEMLKGHSWCHARCGCRHCRIRIGTKPVLVELDPKVRQRVWRLVAIRDLHVPGDPLVLIIESNIDHIIGTLLPVFRAGRSRGGALVIRCG